MIKRIFINYKKVCLALAVMAVLAGFIGLVERQPLSNWTHAWAADHIINLQKVKKISNLVFLPQIVFGQNKLDNYRLDINPSDWQALNDNLPQGNYSQLLAEHKLYNAIAGKNELWAPAKFVYQGQQYDAEAGYWDGQIYLHWFYPQKSWQIRLTNGSPFDFSEFTLIVPHDRSYLGEQLNQFRAKKLGLITPQTDYVNFFVNNKRQGAYYMIEQWSDALLARNGRSQEGCVFGSEKMIAKNLVRPAAYDQAGAWREYTDNCGPAGLVKVEEMLSILDLGQTEFVQQAEKIFDIDKVLRWNVLNRLAGSRQGLPDNTRFYWDDTSGKIEFLPWDFSFSRYDTDGIDKDYNLFVSRILSEPRFYEERNRILAAYVNNQDNLTEDLVYYDQLLPRTKIAFYQDWKKNDSNFRFRSEVKKVRSAIIYNFNKLKDLLNEDN